jgi:hypothetical protein
VQVKYDSMWGGWHSNSISESFKVGVWKNIRRGGGDISQFIGFEVSDYSIIRFWHSV